MAAFRIGFRLCVLRVPHFLVLESGITLINLRDHEARSRNGFDFAFEVSAGAHLQLRAVRRAGAVFALRVIPRSAIHFEFGAKATANQNNQLQCQVSLVLRFLVEWQPSNRDLQPKGAPPAK